MYLSLQAKGEKKHTHTNERLSQKEKQLSIVFFLMKLEVSMVNHTMLDNMVL